MEIITFENDIRAMYVTAASFPEGIGEAHRRLHAKVPFSVERKYLGISRPEGSGGIVYRAAAEELRPGEAAQSGLETLVLKKGKYACITVYDYPKDMQEIGRALHTVLARTDIDPQGYCVEWYFTGKDVRCMVRLRNESI